MNENNKEEEVLKKGKWSWWKKFFLWVALVVVAILGGLIWVGNNTEKISKKYEGWKAERYETALQKYTDEMRVKYTADIDGGKTPEETIELFIAALKAGDIEQASKYYVLEKQKSALDDLKEEISKYSDLHLSIEYFTEVKNRGTKGCNEKLDGCTFEYVYTVTETKTLPIRGRTEVIVIPAGERSTKLIDTGLNKLSGVWKIELP